MKGGRFDLSFQFLELHGVAVESLKLRSRDSVLGFEQKDSYLCDQKPCCLQGSYQRLFGLDLSLEIRRFGVDELVQS